MIIGSSTCQRQIGEETEHHDKHCPKCQDEKDKWVLGGKASVWISHEG
jgi:hypothetical protein